MKNVLVPLADGFEEIEAVTIIDILRRAGANVVTAGLLKRNVEGSHGIRMVADSVLDEELDMEWNMIVLPGGVPGAPTLAEDSRLLDLIKQSVKNDTPVGAICAAPFALHQAGILDDHSVTSHPAWKEKIKSGNHSGNRVEVDRLVITGQSAGTAMEFAFALVKKLFGQTVVQEVNEGVLFNQFSPSD